jgi:hypothetical protein
MWTKLVLPGIAGVTVTRVGMDDGMIWLDARTTGRSARCPIGGRRSKWRHSQYWRTLVDEPCGSTPMRIRLALRGFRCRVPWCPRRIFAERVPSLAAPRVRQTARLPRRLTHVGLAVGGEAGVRLVRAQGIQVSARTVLRLVRTAPLPPVGPVRILGVDDWSQRRGRTFRTILVNLETHTIVDLLPERTAEMFAGWLRQHPEVTIMSRDRAGAYADGATMGAPQARQNADRCHLVKNVTEALERYLTRKHAALRQALLAAGGTTEEPATSEAAQAPSVPGKGDLAQARRARRLGRYQDVLDLHTQGLSGRAIARQTGLSRDTVHQYLATASFPERRARAPRSSLLTR